MSVLLLLTTLACRPPTHPAAPPPTGQPRAHPQGQLDAQPEAATGCRTDIVAEQSAGAMVVSAHPEASRIGAEILRAGGSAVDAAAAMAVALTLVEPQSSGIGGGAFLLSYDAETRQISAWDGRETAPAAASPDQFMADGVERPWPEVVPGGLSVGTPGLLRVLEAVHAEAGALPWSELMAPTIALATEGFEVTPRMARSIRQWENAMDPLRRHPGSLAYFYPGGQALAAGDIRDNPALAATLAAIARQGADAFYTGPIAEHIVAAVQGATRNPGRLSLDDLRRYTPVRREALCLDYRGHRVCGHPPPTSGGTTVLSILGLLERFDRAALEPGSAEGAHLFAEAVRLAWADRDRYLADPAFVDVPVAALLSDPYLAERSARLDPAQRLRVVEPGLLQTSAVDAPACPEGADTTHLVVVDAAGNAVSMTSSIENAWGSGIWVDGFLLNNQLTDFARTPERGGVAVANAVQPCKRPRSSMSPTLVLDPDGELELLVGSPGGSRIIQYTARVLLDVLDHGSSVQEAIAHPNLAQTSQGLELEDDCGTPGWSAATVEALIALGHDVVRGSLNSGLHGIQRIDGAWVSGVDPRREGVAIAVP
ncbi:MAG TPA: gamma-glutamyltransferase [Deltaproteobacteria bacterium]|nr:gamma-glutamyltransferase [Deltaproteobacteria bacterium]